MEENWVDLGIKDEVKVGRSKERLPRSRCTDPGWIPILDSATAGKNTTYWYFGLFPRIRTLKCDQNDPALESS
jgi:hypothetical protein